MVLKQILHLVTSTIYRVTKYVRINDSRIKVLTSNQYVAASGIMCFQCNSARDPGCEDISRNNTGSSYYKPCVPTVGQTKPFFCRTIRQTSKFHHRQVTILNLFTNTWALPPVTLLISARTTKVVVVLIRQILAQKMKIKLLFVIHQRSREPEPFFMGSVIK